MDHGLKHPLAGGYEFLAWKLNTPIFPPNAVRVRSALALRDLVPGSPGLATFIPCVTSLSFSPGLGSGLYYMILKEIKTIPAWQLWLLETLVAVLCFFLPEPFSQFPLRSLHGDPWWSWIHLTRRSVSICCWARNEWSQIWAGLGNKHRAGGKTQKTSDI